MCLRAEILSWALPGPLAPVLRLTREAAQENGRGRADLVWVLVPRGSLDGAPDSAEGAGSLWDHLPEHLGAETLGKTSSFAQHALGFHKFPS